MEAAPSRARPPEEYKKEPQAIKEMAEFPRASRSSSSMTIRRATSGAWRST